MKARDNPFASHRIEALPFRFPPGENWETLLTRLESNSWRGSIVGQHGSGKTTLICEMEPRLVARGFRAQRITFRAQGEPAKRQQAIASIVAMRAPDFLLLDGAEQLTTRQWLSLQSGVVACAGCLISLHRAGRLPSVLTCTPTPALLSELVEELCDASLPEGEAAGLFSRHHGNLRECFRELYNRWAG